MKPSGIDNVQLETVGEAMAAAEAFAFAQDAIEPDDPYWEALGLTATGLRMHAEMHVATCGENSDVPYSFIFEGYVGELALTIIRTCGDVHPDPLVRDATAEMTRSYAEAIFNNSMSETPPPDTEPPRQYRSPFDDD